MLIGSRNCSALKRNLNRLSDYAYELVPPLFRHNKQIILNQKLYIALQVRELKELKYDMKVKLTSNLLEGVYVTGDLSNFVECSEIFDLVDYEKLVYNLFKEDINKYAYR